MARYAEVFEASGGGVSALEARLEALLADPDRELTLEEIAPLPDCQVAVEFVSLAEDAVARALAVLGVPAAECDLLTDLAQACASVARRGAPAPDEEFFTRAGADRGARAADAGAADVDTAGTTHPDPNHATGSGPADPATGEASVGEEAPAVKGRASSLVDAISALSRAAGRLDRVMVSGTRELTAAQGKLLLADKGVASLDELTPGQTDAWRSNAKKRTRTELEFSMGWGAGEVRDLVALAGMSATVTGPVGSALATGEASWRLVRGFIGASGHLPNDLAAGVANALFGDEEDVAATERLTSDREFTGRPWAHREYYRALDREVAKAEANLDEDERRTKSRQKSLQGTDTWGRMDEDGTGTFGMRCTASQVAAILDRVEGAARRARSNGDGRSLGQIRSAVVTTLLLKGTVALPDLPEDPDLITPEQTEQLAAILAGLPAAVLNVIVPLNLLHPDPDNDHNQADAAGESGEPGEPGDGHCTCSSATAGSAEGGADDLAECDVAAGEDRCAEGSPCPGPGSGQDPASDRGEDSAPPEADRGEDSAPGGHDPGCTCSIPRPDPQQEDSASPPGTGRGESSAQPPPQGRFGSGVFGVGEVQGRRSFFLSPQEVSRLALTPGSVMHRLVTDPLTGRCLERSTTAYQFTPAMKTQIAYADGTCRAPGCVIPGVLCQFDHVTEHGTEGGDTREANGALGHAAHHDQKTKKYLDVVINDRREMTWETLLGKIYKTKAHDYTQYSTLLREAVAGVNEAAEEDRGEALDLAIYQAMSYRPGAGKLVAEDDEEFDDHRFQAWDQIRLTRRNPKTGRLVNGPNPEVVKTERDRHARTVQDADAEKDPSDSTGGTTPTDPDTPEHGPWATTDDTPPPF